jgi:hypothetical protein
VSRNDTTESKRRFNGNSGHTSKVTEFGASRKTQAAFQSGQHNRWLAAELCGESADTGSTGLQEDPTLPESPIRPENALHLGEQALLAYFRPHWRTFLEKAKV